MSWLAASAAGVGLGLLHFGGLWLSVRRVVQKPERTAWLPATQAARFVMLAAALAALARDGAGLLIAALVGLWLARLYLVCRLGGFPHGS
jgi:F1F0 ATPase subunit 2